MAESDGLSRVPQRHSWMRSVIDEEDDTLHVMTLGRGQSRSPGSSRSIASSHVQSSRIDVGKVEHEPPVAAVHCSSPARIRYSLNYNSEEVYDAMRVEHAESESEQYAQLYKGLWLAREGKGRRDFHLTDNASKNCLD